MSPAPVPHEVQVTLEAGVPGVLGLTLPFLPEIDRWEVGAARVCLRGTLTTHKTTVTIPAGSDTTLQPPRPGAALDRATLANVPAGHTTLLVAPMGLPPVVAAPPLPMAANNLYDASLGGGRRSVRDGKLRFDLDPPIDAPLTLLLRHGGAAPAGPDDLSPHPEHATVECEWHIRPREVVVTTEDDAPVARLSGPLHTAEIDVAPAVRGALARADQSSPTLAFPLVLTSSSSAPARGSFSHLAVSAFVDRLADGIRVALRGGWEQLTVPIPAGLGPRSVIATVDGRFGSARPLADGDTFVPSSPDGSVVHANRVLACRVERSPSEWGPPARLGVWARATRDTEVSVRLHAADGSLVGAPLRQNLPILVPAEGRPRWHAVDIPHDPGAAELPESLWLVLRASAGALLVPVEPSSIETRLLRSHDSGSTWSRAPGRAAVQIHRSTAPSPGTVEIGWEGGQDAGQVVALRPDGASFRYEGVTLLDASQCAALGNSGQPFLALRVRSNVDADLRILDLTLEYDPQTARR